MICLYVVFNVIFLIFLSTTFARIRPLCSRRSLVMTLFHHCYSFCIKFMQILNRYCLFLTWLRYGLFYIWVKSILRLDLTFPSKKSVSSWQNHALWCWCILNAALYMFECLPETFWPVSCIAFLIICSTGHSWALLPSQSPFHQLQSFFMVIVQLSIDWKPLQSVFTSVQSELLHNPTMSSGLSWSQATAPLPPLWW